MAKLHVTLILPAILLLTGCAAQTPTADPGATEETPSVYTITIGDVSVTEGDAVTMRGTTAVPEGHCLYTQLFADDAEVDWWPVGKCYPLPGSDWQFAVPLGEEGAPTTLDPAANYRLEVWWPGAPGQTRDAFKFDLAAPSAP
jgi:hypothetical protein